MTTRAYATKALPEGPPAESHRVLGPSPVSLTPSLFRSQQTAALEAQWIDDDEFAELYVNRRNPLMVRMSNGRFA